RGGRARGPAGLRDERGARRDSSPKPLPHTGASVAGITRATRARTCSAPKSAAESSSAARTGAHA
ncbi:hypothetical protein AB0A76_30990, partial [Streptomyces exfoliatus]